jgi:hypothetical protein
MGGPLLDDQCEGQWPLTVSEQGKGAPMRAWCQIAAVGLLTLAVVTAGPPDRESGSS